MEKIIGIDLQGNYIYESDEQCAEIDNDDRLISLNKACEWLNDYLPSIYMRGMNNVNKYQIVYQVVEMYVEQFKKAME